MQNCSQRKIQSDKSTAHSREQSTLDLLRNYAAKDRRLCTFVSTGDAHPQASGAGVARLIAAEARAGIIGVREMSGEAHGLGVMVCCAIACAPAIEVGRTGIVRIKGSTIFTSRQGYPMAFALGTSFSRPAYQVPGEIIAALNAFTGIVRLSMSAPPAKGLQRGETPSCLTLNRGRNVTDPPVGYLGVVCSHGLLALESGKVSNVVTSNSPKVVRARSSSFGTAKLNRLGGPCNRADENASIPSGRGDNAGEGRRAGAVLDRQQLAGVGGGATISPAPSDFKGVFSASSTGT